VIVSRFEETEGPRFDDWDDDAAEPAIEVRAGLPAGEWRLVRPLGAGGFGTVWLAEHRALPGRHAALKIPHNRRALARVRRDGLVQARLDAPEVVAVLGLDADATPPYVAYELVEGGTLAGRLPMAPERALAVLGDVAAALAHAHARAVLHLDLKPANILLDRRGRARVTDFGSGPDPASPARALDLSAGLDSVPPAATVAYMAPEQRLRGALDARADVYSFGMVLFEATVGRLPTGLERPREANPALPALVDELYERCCAPIERRIGNGEELLLLLHARGVPLSTAVRARLARRRPRAPIAWRERRE
jgi:serine/threonine protein kinase